MYAEALQEHCGGLQPATQGRGMAVRQPGGRVVRIISYHIEPYDIPTTVMPVM